MVLNKSEIDKILAKADGMIAQKAFNDAVGILREALKRYPVSDKIHRKLGSILMYSPSQQESLKHLEKAVKLMTLSADNRISLANFYIRRKEWKRALDILEKALGEIGEEQRILWSIANLYRELGDMNSALTTMQKLHMISPDNIRYLNYIAELLQKLDRSKEALDIYQSIMKKYRREEIDHTTLGNWVDLMMKFHRKEELQKIFKGLTVLYPKDALVLCYYGIISAEMDDMSQTIASLEEACKLDPTNQFIHYNMGVFYQQIGEIGHSFRHFECANSLDPKTLLNLGLGHTYIYDDTFFRRLNQLAVSFHTLSLGNKIRLHYALGKAYDDVGELETAFSHYKAGGVLHSNGKHQDSYNHLRHLLTMYREKMDKTFFPRMEERGDESDKPVFIVGMPRSGTTLTEQILSGLDGVFAAGELLYGKNALNQMNIDGYTIQIPECPVFTNEDETVSLEQRGAYYLEKVEAIAKEGSRRIIDKLPHNFQWIGPLHLTLPNASFIHMRRHPAETCLSAYRMLFSEGHHWSDDLKTMGMYYRLYTELMAHWKNVLPEGSILDVRYEDVVNNPERESRRIAEHLGIEWHPSCLEFHTKKRAVRTASVAQVRKPMYKDSINRWRKYEPYLQPLLDEIGDLIEAYEAELEEG